MYVEVHVPAKGAGRMVSDDPSRLDPSSGVLEERVARLSQGQLDCLLLVDQHLSSKEIAGELGISSHTVDQRIRSRRSRSSASRGAPRRRGSSPATVPHISV